MKNWNLFLKILVIAILVVIVAIIAIFGMFTSFFCPAVVYRFIGREYNRFIRWLIAVSITFLLVVVYSLAFGAICALNAPGNWFDQFFLGAVTLFGYTIIIANAGGLLLLVFVIAKSILLSMKW